MIERVVRLIDLAEYKRKQMAPGIKVTSRAFGFGRRMPIAQAAMTRGCRCSERALNALIPLSFRKPLRLRCSLSVFQRNCRVLERFHGYQTLSFTTALIVMAVMIAFNYFMKGPQGAGNAAAGPAASPIYQNLPDKPQVSEAGAEPGEVIIGSADAAKPDKLALRINPVTAAVDRAQLNIRDYAQTYERKEPLTLFEVPTAEPVRPFATVGIHATRTGEKKELGYGFVRSTDKAGNTTLRELANDDSADDFNKANSTWVLDRQYMWKVTPGAPDAAGVVHDATLLMTLQLNNVPFLEVTKSFHEDPATYDVVITHTVKNLTDQPVDVAIDQLGAPNFNRDDPRSDDRFFHAASLDTTKAAVVPDAFNVMQLELGKITGGKSIGQLNDYKSNPILWAASSNRFFAAIIRPLPETGSTGKFTVAPGHPIPEPGHIQSADLDIVTSAPKPADSTAMLRFTGATLSIPAHGSVSEPLTAYMGPKKREDLKGSLGSKEGTETYDFAVYDYANIIQFSRGCWVYSFCVFDQLIDAFLWALEFLKHTVAFGNYGLADHEILVVIIRAILHPLTRASQINMAKMGKKMKDVAPKVDAMKKKYADNKRKQSEEMMRIYRENKVNPAGGILGCLPMLIQTPIWIAAWSGVASDINLRQQPFIPGWINDLSNPDTIFPHGPIHLNAPLFTLPLLNFPIFGINPLPVLLAVVLFINTKVTMATQPKPADESQAQMQKMSSYMIFLLPIFLYNASRSQA